MLAALYEGRQLTVRLGAYVVRGFAHKKTLGHMRAKRLAALCAEMRCQGAPRVRCGCGESERRLAKGVPCHCGAARPMQLRGTIEAGREVVIGVCSLHGRGAPGLTVAKAASRFRGIPLVGCCARCNGWNCQ